MGLLSSIKESFCNIFGIETKQEKLVKVDMPKEQKPTSDEEKEKKEDKWKDVNDPLKFVIMGGKVQCTFCSNPIADLIVTSTDISLQDKPWATVGDCDGKINFVFNGLCNHPSQQKPSAPPPPCKAVISLGQWKDYSKTLVNNDNALLMKSKIPCMISGQDLTIIDSGQKTTLSEIEPNCKKKPRVTELYWMDENEKKVIKAMGKGEKVVMIAMTEDFEEGEILKFPVRNRATKEEFVILEGKVNSKGLIKISWIYE